MDAETTLLIFGSLAASKPLAKLIEAVSEHIGAERESGRIKKNADAIRHANAQEELSKADSARIRRHARMEQRLENRECRRQTIREEIIGGAGKELPAVVSDKPPSQDWLHHFFNSCEDVSDKQMQAIWSRLLAGEVAVPGSFSQRTISVVKTLTSDDANLFTTYCGFAWTVDGYPGFEHPHHFVPDMCAIGGPGGFVDVRLSGRRDFIGEAVPYSKRAHLESLGLIKVNPGTQTTSFAVSDSRNAPLLYHGRTYLISPRRSDQQPAYQQPITLQLRMDLFTSVGDELFPLAGAEPNETYRFEFVSRIKAMGFNVVG
ncbi:MAG TPA: DUF2806 domain-containing protein [Planctomycetaceae bacterium]|jgi:hypothetical protein|nr:DUF2806 domain-containing protein [Planctomycetaceae bacterium]